MGIINIKYTVDEFDTHENIVTEIPSLNLEIISDSYHLHHNFYDPLKEGTNDNIAIRRKVFKNFIKSWLEEFKKIKIHDLFMLPIGIHDQYLDLLIFELSNLNKCKLFFISTEIFQYSTKLKLNDVKTYYCDDILQYFEKSQTIEVDLSILIEDFQEILTDIDTCEVKKVK